MNAHFGKFVMTTAMAAFVAVCGSVHADPSAHRVDVSMLRPTHLADYQSASGQSLNDFLLSIRASLRSYSDKHQVEVCGQLAESPDHRYSVMVYTDNSHLGCVSFSANVLPGYTAMPYTVHTHGGEGMFYMNRADRLLAFGISSASNGGLVPIGGENLEHFSSLDFQAAGFLATPTTVRFQNGTPHSECDVKVAECGPVL